MNLPLKILLSVIAGGVIVGAMNANKGAELAAKLYERFKGINEDSERLYPILKAMWMHLGYDEEKADRYITGEVPWSAAMVSYAMKNFPDFPKSASHGHYAAVARSNRERRVGNWWLMRLDEYRPKEGDIVLKSRAGVHTTYDNVKSGRPTHGDIVVKVNKDHLVTIGGNVGNQFAVTKVPIKNGFISDPNYFAIVQNKH